MRNRRDGSVEAVFAGPAARRDGHDRGMPARAVIGAGGGACGTKPANADMLNLREAGERFSVLPTI